MSPSTYIIIIKILYLLNMTIENHFTALIIKLIFIKNENKLFNLVIFYFSSVTKCNYFKLWC